jgi:hypothetical protein
MRTLVAGRLTGLATVVALLVHLLVGCCTHHAHAACGACETQRESTASAKPWHTQREHTVSATHRHTEQGPSRSDHAPAEPKHPHGCDAAPCVYVGSGEDSGAKLGAVPLAAIVAGFVPPLGSAEPAEGATARWNWGFSRPVRLHLLKRVLLV